MCDPGSWIPTLSPNHGGGKAGRAQIQAFVLSPFLVYITPCFGLNQRKLCIAQAGLMPGLGVWVSVPIAPEAQSRSLGTLPLQALPVTPAQSCTCRASPRWGDLCVPVPIHLLGYPCLSCRLQSCPLFFYVHKFSFHAWKPRAHKMCVQLQVS